MPDKRYKKGCGKNCLRCWRNKMKHGAPASKGQSLGYDIEGEIKDNFPKGWEKYQIKRKRKEAANQKARQKQEERRAQRTLNRERKEEKEYQKWLKTF